LAYPAFAVKDSFWPARARRPVCAVPARPARARPAGLAVAPARRAGGGGALPYGRAFRPAAPYL